MCSLYLDLIISVFMGATILKLCAAASQGAAGYFKLGHKLLIGTNYLTIGTAYTFLITPSKYIIYN